MKRLLCTAIGGCLLAGCVTATQTHRLERFAGYWSVEPAASGFTTLDGQHFEIYDDDMPQKATDFLKAQPLGDSKSTILGMAYFEVVAWRYPWHPEPTHPDLIRYRLHVVRVLRMEPAQKDWHKHIRVAHPRQSLNNALGRAAFC